MGEVTRRDALKLLATAAGASVAAGATAAGCADAKRDGSAAKPSRAGSAGGAQPAALSTSSTSAPSASVLSVKKLGFNWGTRDPFLFCVHHDDRYPAGRDHMGPDPDTLVGRDMGRDFTLKDGWRMYHGQRVPGFPQHPHRGFETVTVVRTGLLDHSDSMGASARYGGGDVQWLTAGGGIQHSEMFPLLNKAKGNPLELFQVWLNLPRKNKMAKPHFSMLWRDAIPKRTMRDGGGKETHVAVIAGSLVGTTAPPPPPNSWASAAASDVAIWTIKMAPGATWTIPPASKGTNRTLYFFRGSQLHVAGRRISAYHQAQVAAHHELLLEAGSDQVEILLLQGRPIGEPVARRGPFVMNSREEIRQAYVDYRKTQFGGWPWKTREPVHGTAEERFARHADGRTEKPA